MNTTTDFWTHSSGEVPVNQTCARRAIPDSALRHLVRTTDYHDVRKEGSVRPRAKWLLLESFERLVPYPAHHCFRQDRVYLEAFEGEFVATESEAFDRFNAWTDGKRTVYKGPVDGRPQ